MAKSNLKFINNNGVTQSTQSSVYSKHSYTYYTYIYLNFLFFFRFFYLNSFYYEILDNYLLKFKNKTNSLLLNNKYSLIFFKNYNTNKFFYLNFNLTVKIFFYNGLISHIYDFFILKKYINKLDINTKNTNIKFCKVINNYKIVNNFFIK